MAPTGMRKPIVIVQGGQWGSEAKGAVAAALCLNRNIDIAVRTGAINAGHTVVYNGVKFAMQQIPTGWINPNTKLVIGAGAYIHPATITREINLINEAMPGHDVRDRLFIDFRCGVHTEEAEAISKAANRHHSIGATGKGCSESIVAKIRGRNAGFQPFEKVNTDLRLRFTDTVQMLNDYIDNGAKLLIEGTQGTHLDLHIGPYPYTTSRMTSAANWVAEAGLSPALNYEVVLVCRTFPIRVTGNSGPMSSEIEWVDLARELNDKLNRAGRAPIVSAFALAEFESKLMFAACEAKYSYPKNNKGEPNVRPSSWSVTERNQHRAAASELHRDALLLCGGKTQAELSKLFEMSTVTKKLRRIARLDLSDLRYAVAINRPSWIALTFMDYLVPELSMMTADAIIRESEHEGVVRTAVTRAHGIAESLSAQLGVSVNAVSTGPEYDHFFPTNILDVRQSTR